MRTSLTEMARLHEHGYHVARYPDAFGKPTGPEWVLTDPDGAYLMVGSYGHASPTQWEAVAEGLHRIRIDQAPACDMSDGCGAQAGEPCEPGCPSLAFDH